MKLLRLNLLLVLFLCGCANVKFTPHFPADENGPFYMPSRAEVCGAQKAVAALQVKIDPKREGMVVFDGTLLGAKTLPKQKQELSMEVDSVLFGVEQHVPKKLEIISPTERNGGITVAIGETYRVLMMPGIKTYYTWAALGTAPKDRAFSGYYGCNDK